MDPLTLTLSPLRGARGHGLLVSWLVLVASLTVSVQAAPAQTILVFGDSISAAYGMRVEEGWVALLKKKLLANSKEGYGWRVVNASVSGETTDGGKARLPRALQLHKPRVVILELGANDGLRGLPTDRMKANLQAMVGAARAAGAKVLLVGMPLPANYGPLYTRRFDAVFRDLAREQSLAFVPFVLDDAVVARRLLQEDGLHPTAQAQPRLLDAIWLVLTGLLKTASPKSVEEPR